MTETTSQPIPEPSLFESKLSDLIDDAWDRGSGTIWTATSAYLASELGIPAATVGAISVTTDNVVNNRPLSPGLINRPRRVLLIPVSKDVGVARQAKAIAELIPLTRHLKTVLIAEKVFGVWRGRRLVIQEGVGEPDLVIPHFPAINQVDIIPGDPSAHPETQFPQGAADPEAVEKSDTTQLELSSIDGVVANVVNALADAEIHLEDPHGLARRCVMALATGHLVLQGPPGTAKSTLARLLCRAFDTSSNMVTATADWTTYDVIGGYRPDRDDQGQETLGAFEGCVTAAVRRCDTAVQDNIRVGSGSQAHWLIIDELSRAEIDKAIGPLYSVLGNDDENTIELWFDEEDPVLTIPNRFRIIATLNDVDTSYAYSMSQGLSRRFTFVELAVSSSASVDEMTTATSRAAAWVASTYPSLHGDEDGPTIADAFQQGEGAAAVESLRDLITQIRSGASGTPFPLGTAQLIDVMKRLVLTSTAPDGLHDVLDQSVADLVVPQLASLDSSTLRSLDTYCEADQRASWEATRRRLKTLINPLSTV